MFNKKYKLALSVCLVLFCAGLFFYYFVLNSNGFLKKASNKTLSPLFLAKAVLQPEEKNNNNQSETIILPDFSSFSVVLKNNQADFIEANLSTSEITFYKQGKEQFKSIILKQGDKFFWGGTAAGLYQVIRGYKTAFSAIAEVYMPYAMNFYGKYYLHGEPYYPSGQKMISEVSGGCLQVRDDSAKYFFEKSELKMPLVVIDKKNDDFVYPSILKEKPQISSASFLVADLDSGEILLEKDSLAQKQIASITKLMTAIVVAENVDLRKSIRVQQYMLDLGYG
ncbi:L,D-transpeptidase family protein, partial [Candidatus Gribaldobacteria bacterium]|nr:L,D-transpeptidase family protein [Candidatus Gribaldobacteria bacterium]